VAATSATFLAAALALKGNRLLANMPGLAARLLARELGLAVAPLPIEMPGHQLALLCHARRAGDARTAWFQQRLQEIVAALA
jgi:DNA-binding transcriptional LysR family regulator